jgi:hypothetical protein
MRTSRVSKKPGQTCSGPTRASGIHTVQSRFGPAKLDYRARLLVAIDESRPEATVVYVMLHGA